MTEGFRFSIFVGVGLFGGVSTEYFPERKERRLLPKLEKEVSTRLDLLLTICRRT